MVEQQHKIKKTKVLRIINRFNLGGPTYNAALLTKHLSPEFETILVGGEKDETEADSFFILEQLEIKPVLLKSMKRSIGLKNDWRSYQEIKKIIREFKPDIVHTHASKAGAVGRLAAIHCKVPIIVHTFHGNVFKGYFGKIKTAIYKKLERYLAKKSTAIIAISELQKKELIEEHQICSSNKIHVIPLGFDLSKFWTDTEKKRESFRKKYKLQPNEIAVGIVGRLVPIKNHELFLKAIKIVASRTNQKIRAFVIGDGECYNHLTAFCQKENIPFETKNHFSDSLVTFTSWIKDIDWVNAGIDIAALSSDNEGTPVSLIEAQAAGKPIVSTRVGGIENIVLEGKTALLTAQGNVQEFSEAMLRLIENETLREEMSLFGTAFVKDRFHYQRLASDTKNLYFELLKH